MARSSTSTAHWPTNGPTPSLTPAKTPAAKPYPRSCTPTITTGTTPPSADHPPTAFLTFLGRTARLHAVAHVLARLTGFGLVLVPHWPFAFERAPGGPEAVRVTRWTSSGPRHVVLEPGRSTDGGDVVDVADGLARAGWFVETSIYRVGWPAGSTLESPRDAGDGTPFYLHGPGQATMFPQGPVPAARLAGPDALVGPDQTVLARRDIGDGVGVVELGYRREGDRWWQGRWAMPCGGGRF